MFSKILSSVIIIAVLYILGVFLAPNLTNSIGEYLGIASVNTTIRGFKSGVDSTSDTLLQIKDASGAINGVRDIVQQANNAVDQTTQTINTIRQTGEQKVEQVQKTVDSVKKAGEAISEVQNNLSALTSISGGSTLTGSTDTGSIQTGSGK